MMKTECGDAQQSSEELMKTECGLTWRDACAGRTPACCAGRCLLVVGCQSPQCRSSVAHQNRPHQIFNTLKQTSSNLQLTKTDLIKSSAHQNRPPQIFNTPKQTLSNLKHNKDLIKSSTQQNFTYTVHTVHMCACTHMHA